MNSAHPGSSGHLQRYRGRQLVTRGSANKGFEGQAEILNLNWIHYWSLSKRVTDDDRDLRKSFLLGTHVVGWEEGLGVRRLFLA